jgi:transposase
MGRTPTVVGNAMELAIELIRSTDDADTLRAAQAVLLPLLGLTLEQTAQMVGRDRFWVSRARNRLLRGEPPPAQHGGRRRFLVKEDQEIVLVKEAIAQPGVSWGARVSLRKALRTLLDKQAGQPVSESTVTQVLNRTAQKILPGACASDLQNVSDALARQWYFEKLVGLMLGRSGT